MSSLRLLLLGMLASSHFGYSESSDLFTSIGSSEVLYMNEKLVFTEADRRCREKGSTLAEIWSEEEWIEVRIHLLK